MERGESEERESKKKKRKNTSGEHRACCTSTKKRPSRQSLGPPWGELWKAPEQGKREGERAWERERGCAGEREMVCVCMCVCE